LISSVGVYGKTASERGLKPLKRKHLSVLDYASVKDLFFERAGAKIRKLSSVLGPIRIRRGTAGTGEGIEPLGRFRRPQCLHPLVHTVSNHK
jgi:hypothetical protein